MQAKYNTEVNFISAQLLASRQQGQTGEQVATQPTVATTMADLEADAMREETERLEQEALAAAQASRQGGTRVVGFVRAKVTEPPRAAPADQEETSVNPDEIEINDDDMEIDGEAGGEESEAAVEGLEKRTVPEGVFGGLGADAAKAEERLGAKERFKRKR